MNRRQRDEALDRAFHLDRYSPQAPLPGEYPYRWEVRKANLIICYWSATEQYWYVLSEDTTGEMPGILVHIIVMLNQPSRLIPSIDLRSHVQAENVFIAELFQTPITYNIAMDDLEQDRVLMKQEMDETELPESWKPKHTSSEPAGYR
jgi:hypothetical protein